MLGCTKEDLSRWESNPYSTHKTSRDAKRRVLINARILFQLTEEEEELLANKAGLSLAKGGCGLEKIFAENGCYVKRADLLQNAGVSERMFQYYMMGKVPTKQALLALAIAMELPLDKIESLLVWYGYCLSKSLANDMVVLWFLQNHRHESGGQLLFSINSVLDDLGLPMLMTKLIGRS